MRVLILGAGGMLGHKLALTLEKDPYIKTYACTHNPSIVEFFTFRNIPTTVRTDKLTIENSSRWLDLNVRRNFPDVVINCIGITKHQNYKISDMVFINSVFPHQLSEVCEEIEARLIQVSTDCVFSGTTPLYGYENFYSESDLPDPSDMYGRSKLLGELPDDFGNLTLRTSFIGRELSTSRGLFEWFLSNKGKEVTCYSNAKWSGVTSNELARIIHHIVTDQPHLCGLYHIAAESQTKCELLHTLNDVLDLAITIHSDNDNPVVDVDRTLDASLYKQSYRATDIKDFQTQVEELKEDIVKYDEWRKELK